MGRGKGSLEVGEWQLQSIRCNKCSRVYCITWGIEPGFCNNCEWKVTFKNCIKINNEKGIKLLSAQNFVKTGLISLLSKRLSRVFYNTTVWKYWFFSTQPSLRSNSHIHTRLLEKPQLWLYGPPLMKKTTYKQNKLRFQPRLLTPGTLPGSSMLLPHTRGHSLFPDPLFAIRLS